MAKDTEPATCPICREPVTGIEGAKVYHMQCLYESLKEIRGPNEHDTRNLCRTHRRPTR